MTRGAILTGALARLRPMEARDADRLWESVQDPESTRLTGTTAEFTRKQIDEWAATVADRPERYDWVILSAAVGDDGSMSDEMLGEIVLNDMDLQARSANLRLVLLPAFRGHGYGRDAILQVLKFAFDAEDGPLLHRVSLDVLSINPRACRLYESLGFIVEGRQRDAYLDGEGFVDAILMAILEDEFRAKLTTGSQ